jgi:phosphoribosylaminoimidazole-succinocarboxamide synthase
MRMSPLVDDCWIFVDNLAARQPSLSAAMLQQLWADSVAGYADLPLFCAGNSQELRTTAARGILIGRLLPSLYSYTSNRIGEVPGTDVLRMKISQLFWRKLHRLGIPTCYLACSSDFMLALEEAVSPVEVIVKQALVGTPAHIYLGLFERRDRFARPFVKGERHPPYGRFDYRNPLVSARGERLRDEMLPSLLADRLIDTEAAAELALRVAMEVDKVLHAAGFQLLDICPLFDDAGSVVCGEISPDNMRIKSLRDERDFDKDLWRKDRPAEEIVAQWTTLLSHLEAADATTRDCR